MKEIITSSPKETQQLASNLANTLKGGEIICLSGDLGAGKTTFSQGLLRALGVKGPYTSPTFAIVKEYKVSSRMHNVSKEKCTIHAASSIPHVYHIDAYRIGSDDLLEIGFRDFAGKPNTITIIEWPENVKKLMPTDAVWIKFEWLSEKQRSIIIGNKNLLQSYK